MTNINWTNITVRLGDLKAWPDNPRQSTKAQAKKLLQSFDEFGQVETIAVSPELEVYNGHQRLSALMTIHGKDYQIDARQASRALTEQERKKLTIFLHAGATGSWDWDTLSGWDASEMISWGLDDTTLKEWKHDISGLGELLKSEKQEPVDAEPQIDRAAELNEKWHVKTGDLWKIGEHRLLCGDCTKREDVERVMGGEKAELCLTDPPYGINVVPDSGEIGWSTRQAKVNKFSKVINDDKLMDISFLLDSADKVAIFGGQYFAHYLPKSGRWLVWDKDFTDAERDFVPFSECELVWTNITGVAVKKYKCRSMGYSREGESGSRMHPNQKPLKVIKGIIEDFSKEISTIYDPFAGSGTTMVACQNLNRKCRAIEISPAYCAVILERMSTAFPEIKIEQL